MLLEGHGEEAGGRLVQKPAEFARVRLDQGCGQGVLFLLLQDALCGETERGLLRARPRSVTLGTLTG